MHKLKSRYFQNIVLIKVFLILEVFNQAIDFHEIFHYSKYRAKLLVVKKNYLINLLVPCKLAASSMYLSLQTRQTSQQNSEVTVIDHSEFEPSFKPSHTKAVTLKSFLLSILLTIVHYLMTKLIPILKKTNKIAYYSMNFFLFCA